MNKRFPKTIPFGPGRLRPPHPDEEPDDQSPEALDDWRWTLALEAADDWGDLKPLADCIAVDIPISSDIREQLVSLFNQRRLTRYYPLNDRQRKLMAAAFHYWDGPRSPRETAAQRLERVATDCGVKLKDLAEFVAGKGELRDRLRRERWNPQQARRWWREFQRLPVLRRPD